MAVRTSLAPLLPILAAHGEAHGMAGRLRGTVAPVHPAPVIIFRQVNFDPIRLSNENTSSHCSCVSSPRSSTTTSCSAFPVR